MSNISDNELDKLFSDAAKGFDSPYEEGVWSIIEHKLEGASAGNLSYFKQVGAVLASAVLLVSLLLISQSGQVGSSNTEVSISNEQASDVIQNQSAPESAEGTHLAERTEQYNQHQIGQNKSPVISAHGDNSIISNQTSTTQTQKVTEYSKASKFELTKLETIGANLSYATGLTDRSLSKVEAETSQDEEEEKAALQLGLKATYAPDLSSVGYFSTDRPGSNFGVIAELYFAGRWYVSTGAILSRKIYNTDKGFESYSTQYDIDYVDAECSVIDIPLNIGYSLFKSESQSFFVSTGLSSYIMLSEDYSFESRGYYPRQWSEKYENENNHFFGILNLSIGYERRISQQFFIQLEPFLKSPLDGVGEGKVNLVSTGAMFNLKYIFSK